MDTQKPKGFFIIQKVETIGFKQNWLRKFLIIKYGPTGSGKGSRIVLEEISRLGVPLEDYAVFEIDKLVESIESSKTHLLETSRNLISPYMVKP
jgi:hypothetical protein